MEIKILVRAFVAAIYGILFGLYTHSYRVKWGLLGRDAYLNRQAAMFDHRYIHPRAFPTFISCIIIALLVAGSYELIVAGLLRLVTARRALMPQPR